MHQRILIAVSLFLCLGFLPLFADDKDNEKNSTEPPKYFVNPATDKVEEILYVFSDNTVSSFKLFNTLKPHFGKGSKKNKNTLLLVANFNPQLEKANPFSEVPENLKPDFDADITKFNPAKILTEVREKYKCSSAKLHAVALFRGVIYPFNFLKNKNAKIDKLTWISPPLDSPRFFKKLDEIKSKTEAPKYFKIYLTNNCKTTVIKLRQALKGWAPQAKYYWSNLSGKSIYYVIKAVFAPEALPKVRSFKRRPVQIPEPEVKMKIFNTKDGSVVSYNEMILELINSDVIFFGEFHDSTETHRLEINTLTALYSQRTNIAVSFSGFDSVNLNAPRIARVLKGLLP